MLVNMANAPKTEEKNDDGCCIGYEEPKYPYGLCLSLDNEMMTKLGITDLLPVGTVVTITAKAKVTRASASEELDGGARKSMELQITDMETTTGARSDGDMAKALYPGMA